MGKITEKVEEMTILIFSIFIAAILISIITGTQLLYAMLLGCVLFSAMARLYGYSFKEIGGMMFSGVKTSFPAFFVFLLVGVLTAAWRASGTIAYFVYWGVKLILPQYFLLCAFLILAVESMLIGTSFGSSATLGVMLLVMAKSGGVPEMLAAGAILSGAMVGDRGSPMSSSANLVAAVTKTEIGANVRRMVKSGALPFLLTAGIFLLLSRKYPLGGADTGFIAGIAEQYAFSPLLLLPAVIVLILPLFQCSIRITMGASLVAASLLAIFLQKTPVTELLSTLLYGYHPTFSGEFAERIAGGGFLSMVSSGLLLLAASTYSGIFQTTGVLHGASDAIRKIAKRFGLMAATLVTGLSTAAIACNQTLSIILTEQLTRDAGEEAGALPPDRAMLLENTVVPLASFVPWNLCSTTQLTVLAVSPLCVFFAVYLYMVPLVNLAISLVQKNQKKASPPENTEESAAEE